MNPIVNPTVDPIVNTVVNPTPPKDQDLPERLGIESFYYSYEEGGEWFRGKPERVSPYHYQIQNPRISKRYGGTPPYDE